jgi:hypothetical protein
MWQHRRKSEGSTAGFLDGQPAELKISDKSAFVKHHVKIEEMYYFLCFKI